LCCFKKFRFQSLVSMSAEMLYQALAPSDAPSTAPDIAAEPSSELASRKSLCSLLAMYFLLQHVKHLH